MDTEKKSSGITTIRDTLLGVIVSADILASAVFGFFDPFLGAVMLAGGLIFAVILFVFGLIQGSCILRRFSYLSVGLAIVVSLAAIATLFVNKGFEDRCVNAWKNITEASEKIERRVDHLEDRFDNDRF